MRWLAWVVLFTASFVHAESTWQSAVTNSALPVAVQGVASADPKKPTPTVVYLKGLSVERVGTDSDDAIVADLVKDGLLVITIDYGKATDATAGKLPADVLKLREDLTKKKLLADVNVDGNRIYILAEGYRLKRDVKFAIDGPRTLGMDIMYPSHTAKLVSSLMEITCDNANRMGSGSLLFCHDTLVEGAQFRGFAVAMVDHPVAPPYKGIDDPMPQLVHRMKAAVRTLRAEGKFLGFSGKIGVMGFSRGGPMAALLASTNGRADLEGDGEHRDTSSDVQVALVHGNRYDYLSLKSDDPMLARFTKAWGPLADNRDKWAAHGAVSYLDAKAAPMFLNTSDTESPEFREGLATLDRKLTELKVEHEYLIENDGRGHRVTTDPATLDRIYVFFAKHLN